MAIWDRTKNELQRHIETTVRTMRKGVAIITAEERFTIFGAINEAIIDIALERSIDAPKAITSDTTATTTASTAYVDLASTIINVVDGTVRITAEDQILTRMSIAEFYAFDVGEDITGLPYLYALDTNGSGALRLLLRPTPDAVYTIAYKAESMPDEDEVSQFPGWYHGLLRSLATALALENLGINSVAQRFQYEEKLKNIRDKQRGFSGPIHIPLRSTTMRPTAPELRISGGNV